ncbi:MAG TPA: GTPase domain-containing protein, partial [Natrialbaceae archaeon]|nr:GTPase domain-containing protein [Natrialbaceae archaeon]
MNAPSTVLLMGHPNVGKSALFNRLADADITESNYPGTTVDY